MHTIHKYPLGISSESFVLMPKYATIVDVAVQDGTPCIWAFVDTDKPIITRRFHVYGTGHPIDAEYFQHLATLHMPPFVWHVFDLGEEKPEL